MAKARDRKIPARLITRRPHWDGKRLYEPGDVRLMTREEIGGSKNFEAVADLEAAEAAEEDQTEEETVEKKAAETTMSGVNEALKKARAKDRR